MKVKHLGAMLFMVLLVGFVGCDEILEQIDTLDVTVHEPVYSGTVERAPTDQVLLQHATIGGTAPLGKAVLAGYTEIEMAIADWGTLVTVLQAGGGSFSGQVTNNAATAVDFVMYASDTPGLDPFTDDGLVQLLEVTIAGGGSFDFINMNSFDALLLGLLYTLLDTDTIYFYLTADGETLDVEIENLTFHFDAHFFIEKTIGSAVYAEYEDRVNEVLSTDISGEITNSGTATVTIWMMVSAGVDGGAAAKAGEIDPSMFPDIDHLDDHPDLVAKLEVLPGETIDFANNLAPGGNTVLVERLEALMDSGVDIFAFVVLLSDEAINLTLDSISIDAVVEVST